MLQTVLEQLEKMGGVQTELIELVDYNIKLCDSCNKCLHGSNCSITDDDMLGLAEKLLSSDGIVLGSPVYWRNVTTRMKNFMDRTRFLHIHKNLLFGKIGAAVTHAGLRNGGQEMCIMLMETFLSHHGMVLAGSRYSKKDALDGAMGTLFKSFDGNKIIWKKDVYEDEITLEACRRLGKNMYKLLKMNKG